MVVSALLRFAQLLVAACIFVACSSTPTLPRSLVVNPGERTTVHLLQVNGSLALSLQNESAQVSAEVYTAASSEIDPGRKVVADANLQALLDVFTDKGMFAASLNEVPRDARDVLMVEQGKRRWIWVRRQLGVQQAEQTFHEARSEFLALYNSSIAYHGTGESRPDFRAENARARAEAEKARLNLEQKNRSQR